ncbi:hypothetical protein ACHAXA_008180 [Cyclostephanos tholiformis]|uniref:EF-hand domain-containing protein n=1 Tax=Cyclostephanos tholiformis TaxID=382380 RepID=A0ABD3SCC3_9STRA
MTTTWWGVPSQSPDASSSTSPRRDIPPQLNIDVAFRMFDETSSTRIDVPTFVIMAHSLGLRTSAEEVMRDVEEEDGRDEDVAYVDAYDAVVYDDEDDDDDDDGGGRRIVTIDVELAKRILKRLGYDDAKRNVESEMRAYFDAFDVDNKGYVNLKDLRRIRDEVCEADMGDASLGAMIEHFDDDGDGVVDYREFRNVLRPLFFSP